MSQLLGILHSAVRNGSRSGTKTLFQPSKAAVQCWSPLQQVTDAEVDGSQCPGWEPGVLLAKCWAVRVRKVGTYSPSGAGKSRLGSEL